MIISDYNKGVVVGPVKVVNFGIDKWDLVAPICTKLETLGVPKTSDLMTVVDPSHVVMCQFEF